MEKRNSSTQLIEVLLKSIDKMGIKKTIQILEVSQNFSDDNKRLIETTIVVTCNHFNITHSVLLSGRKNIPNRTNAIGICAVLLLRICKLSQREISAILKKDASLINKYIKRYDNLDMNFKDDLELANKMNTIRNEIESQIKITK